jgi:hypothetical protein
MKKSVFNKNTFFYGIFWCFAVLLCFASCRIHNQVSREEYKSIPIDFSGKFYDQLDTIVGQYDNRIYTKSFMKQLVNIENINYSKPIKIDIKEKEMYLSFEDVHAKQFVLKFYGNRKKNKFVFYTNYETISFPILFITKEMDKYAIYLSDYNEVIFNNHSVNEGMLLIIGGGNSSKRDYKFKLL